MLSHESLRTPDFALKSRTTFLTAQPFPHLIIDSFFEEKLLLKAFEEFPKPHEVPWFVYDNIFEKKLALPQHEILPAAIQDILKIFVSAPFVDFLKSLTGISNLIPDPSFYGGGLHQIERGGKLDIHADFNFHPVLKVKRQVNVILYLNYDWREDYGGHLELWDEAMTACQKRVLPQFNRAVIFLSNDKTFHGHPEPLQCPIGNSRKSIASYYYSPIERTIEPHSTVYRRRPQDPIDQEIENLRLARARGRLRDQTK